MTDPAEITAQIAEARSVEWTLIGDDEPALEVRLADSAEWLLKRVAALEAQKQAALDLHRKHHWQGSLKLCDECLMDWPCDTFRALDGEETT